MIRLSILLVHSVTGSVVATGAVLSLLQALANARWEATFYGQLSDGTQALTAVSIAALALGLIQVAAICAWMVGRVRAGWFAAGISLVLLGSMPWLVGLLLVLTSVGVALDIMVVEHRRRAASSSG